MMYRDFLLPDWANFDSDHFDTVELPIIEEVTDHFRNGARVVFCQMPTGCGKSVIGECVRQSLDTSGTYACSQLVLQSQFDRDWPHAELIQGRANYRPLLADDDERWGSETPTCADCDYDHATELCTFCGINGDRCPYTVAKLRAAEAPLVNANYSYLLNEWKGERSKFSGRDLLIADEGDVVPEEILRMVSVSISPRMQRFLDLRAPRYKTKEDSWQEWFHYAIPHVEARMDRMPRRELRDKRRYKNVTSLLDRLQDISGNLEGWLYEYGGGKIEFKPVTVDHVAPRVFWPHAKRFLFMSATIISPHELAESLGYDGGWQFVEAPSVFAKENRPIYFYPGARMVGKPEVQKENAWPDMGLAVVTALSNYPDDRVLVHTNSKALTLFLRDYVCEAWGQLGIDRALFHYANGDERQPAIDAYDQTPGAVLLAMSLQRGWSGDDDRCRAVIVCKTPFASLGDKQVSTRLYGTPTGRLWYDVMTTRTLVQSTGRAVRGPNDHADTILLDSQFASFYSKRSDLFPGYWREALHMDGPHRFEMRKAVREMKVRLNGGSNGSGVT